MKRLALLVTTLILVFVVLGAASSDRQSAGAEQGAPFNPHGNYSAVSNSCMTCHQARLTVAGATNACSSCHPKIQSHEQQSCADCHEPHAQTSNAAMIQASIGGKSLRFTGKNFDDSPNAVCRTCHTSTNYHSTSAKATHYEDQDCTRCHPHAAGFRPDPSSCTACHGEPPERGAHIRHMQTDIGLSDCESCHPAVRDWRDAGHRNGRVDFNDDANLAQTRVCAECHGNTAGVAAAKANWRSGSPIPDCTGCHNSLQPGRLHGKSAPAVDAYWQKNGHGVGADEGRDLDCQACHNPKAPHFGADSLRLWDQPENLCSRCHNDSARAGRDVSRHGNTGFDFATQQPFVEGCNTCHNPHGSPNLSAIRPPIRGDSVSFLARIGADSFDEPDDNNADDLCATCHASTAHNRTPSNWRQLPHHEGEDCATCHKHETDGDSTTADAFMPKGSCMDCHAGAVDNGDGVPPGGRRGVGPDFRRRTHHLDGDLTDARCKVCHDQTSHGDGYIDLRNPDGGAGLRFITADQSDLTPFCQACHDDDGSRVAIVAGGAPADPFAEGSNLLLLADTSSHSNQDFHGRQEDPFRKSCNSCHAGHGSDNLAIVRQSINGNSIIFTARTGKDSFDDPNKDDRNDLCATCHVGKTSIHAGGDHRPAGDLDLRGADCTTCHQHDADNSLATVDAFMPSCNACHGTPPPPAGNLAYGLDENLTPHRKHAGVEPGQYGQPCSTCHDRFNPAYSGHVTQPASFQDVFFSSLNPQGSYDRLSRTCATVGCHSNGAYNTNEFAYTPPAWGENSKLDCSGCHGDQQSLSTGSHGKHLLASYRDRGYDAIGCYECHAGTARDDDNGALASIEKHVNFQKNVRFDLTDVLGQPDGAQFNPTDRTCANSLCHSDGVASREQPGQPTFATPKWGDPASGACGTCHAVENLTTGAHARHFDNSLQGPGIESCDSCHSSYADGKHVNGKVDFTDGQTLARTSVCNDCHSPGGVIDGVAEARGKWAASSPVRCEGCHDGQPSTIKGVTAADIGGDGNTYGFDVTGHGQDSVGAGCAVCHQKTPDSIHFDGNPNTYDAEADNYIRAKWLLTGLINVPIQASEFYKKDNYGQCLLCHNEADQVGLAANYSNALFTHSNPPPAGYPLSVAQVVTRFRNERPEGFNFDNIPANIHWDHLDMNQLNWDSDGDGKFDSKPSCMTCHDPHGVKSVANGVVYPAMTNADMGIVYGQDTVGAYGESTRTDYGSRCRNCHPSTGIRYYRP